MGDIEEKWQSATIVDRNEGNNNSNQAINPEDIPQVQNPNDNTNDAIEVGEIDWNEKETEQIVELDEIQLHEKSESVVTRGFNLYDK